MISFPFLFFSPPPFLSPMCLAESDKANGGASAAVSRVKDNWADVRTTRSRVSGTGWKPWLLDGYYQEFYERKARPRRCAVDAPSRSSFEAAAVFDTDPLAFPARESSAFTRGVRAFKAMVIRQPDESQ